MPRPCPSPLSPAQSLAVARCKNSPHAIARDPGPPASGIMAEALETAPETAPAAPPAQPLAEYTRAQVQSQSSTELALVILHNVVYDLTPFIDLHPGGASVLNAYIGRDATGAFEAIGHSTQAREWAEKYRVGEIVASERILL